MDNEGVDSLHKCNMCGSCGRLPWWAPEVLKQLEPRERIRRKRRLEDGVRAFVAAREEVAAKKAAAEAASAALKAFATGGNGVDGASTSNSALPGSFELGASLHVAEPRSAPPPPPGTGVLQTMKTKQEVGFGADNDGSLEKIQFELKEMRESALATYDSDIDSDDGAGPATCIVIDAGTDAGASAGTDDSEGDVQQTFHTPKGNASGEKRVLTTPSTGGGTYYTPRTGFAPTAARANGKPEAISLVPASSPLGGAGVGSSETPELETADSAPSSNGLNSLKVPTASADLGTVSLASSPDASAGAGAQNGKRVLKELKVPPNDGSEENFDSLAAANKRVRELELHIEALECALKARELVASGKKSTSKKGTSEVVRLRDEVDSLRLTVDFLFRKLQRYEASPRDRPEAH